MSNGLGVALNSFLIFAACWLIGYFIWVFSDKKGEL